MPPGAPCQRFEFNLLVHFTLALIPFACILLPVDPETPSSLICQKCGASHDPSLRFCTKCGSALPVPKSATIKKGSIPSGRARGIEPPKDALYDTPLYTDGYGAEKTDTNYESIPPEYEGVDDLRKGKPEKACEKKAIPVAPANSCWVGFMILLALAFPPAGLVAAISWAFMPAYRKAAIPALMAALIGGGLWGWGIYADLRHGMHEAPHKALSQYMSAQDWALETDGHYMSMTELRRAGYLPGDFPDTSMLEFEIVEHILGPTGYLVEARPGGEEKTIYRMRSIWVDNTGVFRFDSATGPPYQ